MADKLEENVRKYLEGVDSRAVTTIGSGNKLGDEDVKSDHYIVQCKRSSKRANFIVSIKDWHKLQSAAVSHKMSDGNYRVPFFVVENCSGERVVVIDIDDFFCILSRNNQLASQLAYGGSDNNEDSG